jgi:drug/metabolite transporter (DMT)-like permease
VSQPADYLTTNFTVGVSAIYTYSKLLGEFLRFRWNQPKLALLMGTLLVVPWECFLTFGFTFTMRAHESLWVWAFVLFAFLLNIPAVLLSWFLPRQAALWILANTAISMAIGAGFQWKSYLDNPHSSASFISSLLTLFAGLVGEIVLLWFAPLAFAFGILIVLNSSELESGQMASPETNPSR